MTEERTLEKATDQELAALAKEVVVLAMEKHVRLATVESCTGGLVAHMITEVPGASQVFETAWVCYSDRSKIDLLGVPEDTIMEHGAVSREVAEALASGARQRIGVDLVVATTGIAGPTGARPGKPVGLMWCCVADSHGTSTHEVLVRGLDRSATKRAFAREALMRLLERIGKRRT